VYNPGSSQAAETKFNQLSIKERAKFERENKRASTYSPSFSTPTLAVVSLVVAVRGKSSAYKKGPLRSSSELRDALQNLAADALTDDGDNILAAEVLWTPSDAGEVLSSRDIVAEYPELLDL
jgi:uncharacterized membrane protein